MRVRGRRTCQGNRALLCVCEIVGPPQAQGESCDGVGMQRGQRRKQSTISRSAATYQEHVGGPAGCGRGGGGSGCCRVRRDADGLVAGEECNRCGGCGRCGRCSQGWASDEESRGWQAAAGLEERTCSGGRGEGGGLEGAGREGSGGRDGADGGRGRWAGEWWWWWWWRRGAWAGR